MGRHVENIAVFDHPQGQREIMLAYAHPYAGGYNRPVDIDVTEFHGDTFSLKDISQGYSLFIGVDCKGDISLGHDKLGGYGVKRLN